MSDCTDFEKPASADPKSCLKNRKSLPLLIRGRLGSDLIRPFGPPSPLRGRLLRAKRKVCPCEKARRADVAPSAPFRGHFSHRERQGPHGYLPFLCLFWGQYTPFPGKCPVPTSGRSPALCPGTAAPTPPAAARRGRPGRPGADRSHPASGESGRAPCSGG